MGTTRKRARTIKRRAIRTTRRKTRTERTTKRRMTKRKRRRSEGDVRVFPSWCPFSVGVSFRVDAFVFAGEQACPAALGLHASQEPQRSLSTGHVQAVELRRAEAQPAYPESTSA